MINNSIYSESFTNGLLLSVIFTLHKQKGNTMKFTPNDYSVLSGAIKRYLALYTKEEITQGIKQFKESSKANNKYIAFIWAIFFKVRNNDMTINDMIHERSNNGTYNDIHIETALKKIFKEYGINSNLELNY